MTDTPTLTWGNTRILFAMATDQEYGVELQKRLPPLIVGVGPVEAALGIGAALATVKPLPDLVVSLGSAGSAKLEQGSVHEISSVSYRDMDASPLGFEKGVTPFLDQPATIPVKPIIDGVPKATLSTGANIVSGASTTPSTPIWWTWKASRLCAPARPSASIFVACAVSRTGPRSCAISAIGPTIYTSSMSNLPRRSTSLSCNLRRRASRMSSGTTLACLATTCQAYFG
jgi:hypothetical protein